MNNRSLFWSQHAIPKYSKGPMTAHQNDLRKQPLPPLKNSLVKYLDAVRPLTTEEEYRITEKIVHKFGAKDGVGEQLYSVLQEQYRTLDNWIEDRWVKGQLLTLRCSISPYNTASVFVLKTDFESQEEQLRFVSCIVHSVLDFKKMIDCHQLKPDSLQGKLLDMSEYFLLFSTTQIPFKNCDNIIHYGDLTHSSSHIIVARRNKFFQMNVFNEDETFLTNEEIFEQLQIIVSQTGEGLPIGVLTSQNRDTWADAYQRLFKENEQILETIQSALFVLCLDKSVSEHVHFDVITRNMHNLIHGCGPRINGGNRWFDCGMQIIITDDGTIGLNTGSSILEAQPFQRMLEHSMIKAVTLFNKRKKERKSNIMSSLFQQPKELQFSLTSQLLEDIETAKLNFQNACDEVDIEILKFNNFGKDFIKSHNLSIDSFIQMAYQLTFYRLHGNKGVVCSVATLHNFYRGHYDLLQTTTDESISFCKAMLDETVSEKHRLVCLMKALKKHKDIIKEALNGYGINYLLFGLKKAAEENGMKVPEIFEDPAYSKFLNHRLITSQVPGVDLLPHYFSYGPFTEDGYGCPYFVYPDKIHFCIFSVKNNPETNSSVFLEGLKISLLELKNILCSKASSL